MTEAYDGRQVVGLSPPSRTAAPRGPPRFVPEQRCVPGASNMRSDQLKLPGPADGLAAARLWPHAARELCARRTGVGADGPRRRAATDSPGPNRPESRPICDPAGLCGVGLRRD